MTEWNPDSGKYSRIKLVPCALRRGTPEQSLADARLGEPRVWAETSEGDFCYCTEEEAALRRSLVERPPEAIPEDLVYRPEDSETGGKSPLLQGLHTSPMMRILLRQRRKQRGRSPRRPSQRDPPRSYRLQNPLRLRKRGTMRRTMSFFPLDRTLQNRPSGARPARRLWTFRSPPGKKRSFRFLR